MESLIGKTLGNYQIKSLLGKQRGRRTFLAEDVADGALVVLKLILFGPDFTWEDLKLFEREAETLKSLDHAAIPKYLDSFEVDTALGKGFVLAQTYIEARSLQDWMTSGRRFSEQDLKEIAQSILVILQYLHSRHPAVVHRDIKPSNILMGDYTAHSAGKIYLVDFGSVQVAQHGGTMTVVGTYGYMPPEQFGGRATPASDLYSLGATLVYLATGQHPAEFAENSLAQAITSHISLSSHFTQWIRQLTYAEAHKRISSAALAFHELSHSSQIREVIAPDIVAPGSRKPSTQAIAPSAIPQLTKPKPEASISIANGAFIAQSDERSLTLQFYRHRIRERLHIQQPDRNFSKKRSPQAAFMIYLTVLISIALVIVVGTSSTSAIAFLVSILTMIALIWVVMSLASSDHKNHSRIAKMTLIKASNASILLTVKVIHTSVMANDFRKEEIISEYPTQFIDVPVKLIKIAPDSLGSRALFIFPESDSLICSSHLSIGGSQRGLKTLLRYIGEWDSTVVHETTEYPFTSE